MEHEGQVLPDGHLGSLYHVFHFRERQLDGAIVELIALAAGGDRIDHRLVIPEQAVVVRVEVVIPDDAVMAQGVVKGGVQMDILAIQFQNIPGVAVLDTLFRVGLGDGNDAPQSQGVT